MQFTSNFKSKNKKKIAVIGAGSWGTALAKLLSDKGEMVSLWGHDQEHIITLRETRENIVYLPGFRLNHNVKVTADIQEAISGSNIIAMVVPSHVFRRVFAKIIPFLDRNVLIISATKGIEKNSLMTMTQVMAEMVKNVDKLQNIEKQLGVLSGPSFAKEVAAKVPTAVTVAASSCSVAKEFQRVFFTQKFRIYTSTDMIGVELGGALKNIIAIAVGICDGLGYGTNTRAALITRGLAEITRLGVKTGANPLTFSGLAGLGDLVLTCTGNLSRNRMVGFKLGQGKNLTTVLAEMKMVAEGVKTTKSAWSLAQKMNIEMPILEQIYQVIYQNKPCEQAVCDLLNREQKKELSF